MKLSEALTLKAEWWVVDSLDVENNILEDILENSCGKDMFDETAGLMIDLYETKWLTAGNETASYLCLLEAEHQKDKEDLEEND
jgi:regulation of enolase protein 1 (concanavalin A-like superfamily)